MYTLGGDKYNENTVFQNNICPGIPVYKAASTNKIPSKTTTILLIFSTATIRPSMSIGTTKSITRKKIRYFYLHNILFSRKRHNNDA